MEGGDEVSVEQLSSNLSTYEEQLLQVCNFHATDEFGCLFYVPSCNCNCNCKGRGCYFLIEGIQVFRAISLWFFFLFFNVSLLALAILRYSFVYII